MCTLVLGLPTPNATSGKHYISAIGDPEMKNPNIRIALEAWNFCNEVGQEAPNMGSPRTADCADIYCPLLKDALRGHPYDNGSKCNIHHKVKESDNTLGTGDKFPITGFKAYTDPDLYPVEKELYLASLCEVHNATDPWQFWMIMVKNGSFDRFTTICPENGKKSSPMITESKFTCFGEGCMNQPLVYHSRLASTGDRKVSLAGSFYGTHDLNANLSQGIGKNSYFSVKWKKNSSTGCWIISHRLTTSSKYPWLMLYLRANATKGFNGGYHYEGRGILKQDPGTRPSINVGTEIYVSLTRETAEWTVSDFDILVPEADKGGGLS
ncbi:hypothetical protein BVC80_1729g23 [Macleaya cordata]|uniref:DUF7705 domain-containing protein n=1 Tax=Macleaya cordata TaxID=56857 RepID=A0A200QCB0_MACCD|nr:hypothetical protein BVC80_1729g23 [Macleaya cordata]